MIKLDNKEIIDRLILGINAVFKGCVYAHAAMGFGNQLLDDISDHANVTVNLKSNLQIEPIPIYELKQYRDGLEGIILEAYHGKLVQYWNECLSNLFLLLVKLHVNRKRKFEELGKKEIRLDFGESRNLEQQVGERLVDNFGFSAYKDKIKLLNKVFNPKNKLLEHQENILKNVLVRNQFQHHGGIVNDYLLRELGNNKIIILSSEGKEIKMGKGDAIKISIPEIDSFCSSLMMVGQIWRNWNGY